ncbi:MAG: SDR family oxidoreductase [Myxococcota bacterium]
MLDRCRLVTWGETARVAYEQTQALTRRAGEVIPAYVAAPPVALTAVTCRQIGVALRGAMWRATDRSWFVAWRDNDAVRSFLERTDSEALASRGCAIPCHVPWVKPWPLILPEVGGGDARYLGHVLDEAFARYRARGEAQGAHDPWPRVVLAADVGIAGLGRTRAEAERAVELYEHAIEVMSGAAALGDYEPAPVPVLLAHDRAPDHASAPDQPLAGKVALVTGATNGIGVATCRIFLEQGAHVVLCDRDQRVLEAVSEWPKKHHPGRFVTVECDVSSERDCERAVDETCAAFGGLDILVSNAGVAPKGFLHTEGGHLALSRSLDVNLLGHQRIARAVSEVFLDQNAGGVLLFNASKSAFHQGPQFGPYSVPKAALLALMRQYAIDLGEHGVRSNAVNADRIRTKLFGRRSSDRGRGRGPSPSEYFRSNLLRRETATRQVGEAFAYLATAEATTGCVLTVDGGNPAAFPR